MFNEKDYLEHFGIPGMRWGRRKAQPVPTGPGPRRFQVQSLSKNMDGRKVNKLFGKRNRDAVKKGVGNFLFGDPKQQINNSLVGKAFLSKKYNQMDKKSQKEMESKVRKAAVAISGVALAALTVMISRDMRR